MANRFFPDLDQAVATNGVVSLQPPSGVLSLEPRANGTGSVVLAGTYANHDVLTIKFTASFLPGGSISITATCGSSDTKVTMAEALAAAIMANSTLAGLGLIAEAANGTVNITWPGPLGKFVTLTFITTGSETGTITQITGGSGPVIPKRDDRFAYNGAIVFLTKERPILLGADALAFIVNAGYQFLT